MPNNNNCTSMQQHKLGNSEVPAPLRQATIAMLRFILSMRAPLTYQPIARFRQQEPCQCGQVHQHPCQVRSWRVFPRRKVIDRNQVIEGATAQQSTHLYSLRDGFWSQIFRAGPVVGWSVRFGRFGTWGCRQKKVH